MNKVFESNINQVQQIFQKIFVNVDISKKFIRSFIASYELNTEILSEEQIIEIKKALLILVENAKVEETRKQQQQYYMPVLQAIMNDTFLLNFDNDIEFRLKFIELVIVMLDKSNLHDKDAEHHIHIANNLTKAVQKI